MSNSCFKIISCGGRDAIDDHDLESSPQSKGGVDKRGWSFRKRSARHRVLSNTVSSETPPSVNKGSPESAAIDIGRQPKSTIPEKISATQWTDEKTQLPTLVNLKLSDTVAAEADDTKVGTSPCESVVKADDTKVATSAGESSVKADDTKVTTSRGESAVKADDAKVDTIPGESAVKADDATVATSPDETVVIIIQTGIRGFLAQNVLVKHKNIIKLQAAVRGHFVRKQAVGTLRCVQAIVKMQALVRARRAHTLEEESSATQKRIEKLEKENSGNKSQVKNTSIEKLLSNKFAQQLLESTPRTKTINVKCDPLKSDSAWKWLERWMLVSSTRDGLSVDTEQPQKKEVDHADSQEEIVVLSESNCETENLKPAIETCESDDNLITYDSDRLEVQACRPALPPVSDNLDQPVPHSMNELKSEEFSLDSSPTEGHESDLPCKLEPNTIPSETDTEGVGSLKRTAPEQPETQGKKSLPGSRKASNPVFLAVQSKFEELSTAANSTKSLSSINRDTEVESYADTVSSFTNHVSGEKEANLNENNISGGAKVQCVDSATTNVQLSECGTELSISSTLASPDRKELGADGHDDDGQFVKDRNGHPESKGNLEVDAVGDSSNFGLPHSDDVQPERHVRPAGVSDGGPDSETSVDFPQVEKKLNTDVVELQMEAETDKCHQESRSSPKASPRIHVTVPETHGTLPSTDEFKLKTEAETEDKQLSQSSPETSPRVHKALPEPQGTPSSEVSVKPKRIRSGKNRMLKSSSAGKRISSGLNHDSGARNSSEQQSKDHKAAKRRNSIGSPKPDHLEQEPRDSTSSNSLPSYMQPTESARAKALLTSSPRSSPDLQEKEVYMKKRHSLPGANGRHGSPQIQRTMSEARQAEKGNESQSPQEKKWRR